MERLPSKVWADETHAVPTRELNEDPFHTSSHHHEHGHGHEHGVGEGIEKRSQPMQPVHDSTTADTAVADDDRNPTRKATAADKLIGKAQAVVGKVAHKPEMQEKGELRQTEGKPSV
ncbi:hypothetical protein MKEN_01399600 [Mycena kentingensis (nom. inval.)]|nr:hypothetical protein MKEN_01399600 [Mycena kentingensis (nom. inval.)]